MKLSSRNPVFRSKLENGLNETIGKLEEDIMAKELEGIEGGTTLACVGTYLASQTLITQLFRCGVVLTTSAECSRTGNSC